MEQPHAQGKAPFPSPCSGGQSQCPFPCVGSQAHAFHRKSQIPLPQSKPMCRPDPWAAAGLKEGASSTMLTLHWSQAKEGRADDGDICPTVFQDKLL